MDKTLRFEIVSGINKGYFHDNRKNEIMDVVGNIWQKIAKEEFEISGIYVTAVIKSSKTIYNEEWGCPKDGEETVVITGIANRAFVDNLDKWKNSVIKLAKKLKKELGQSTLTCEFLDTELHYFR